MTLEEGYSRALVLVCQHFNEAKGGVAVNRRSDGNMMSRGGQEGGVV